MNYRFSEDEFKNNFNWKSAEEKSQDSLRISHIQDRRFKLFPYKANGKVPIVTDMKEVIGDFIKVALGIETPDTDFNKLMEKVKEETDSENGEFERLSRIIRSLFYSNNKFTADNIGLYAYKGATDNKSVEQIAVFLNDIFDIDSEDVSVINTAMDDYPYNALEKLMTDCLDSIPSGAKQVRRKYYIVFEDAANKFKKDFQFMLENGMSSPDDLSDLLSLYYLYYTSQTCITLDHFGNGNRKDQTPMFFALDWEKVSANRECCKGGWKKLQENVGHIFSHAVTLELLNQTDDLDTMYDYRYLSDLVENQVLDDHMVATEILKIEKVYMDSVGDYKGFSAIEYKESKSETDSVMRHLFECVNAQFVNNRKSANDKYIKKLLEFYRSRWLKNRKKSGLVLNLTDVDCQVKLTPHFYV